MRKRLTTSGVLQHGLGPVGSDAHQFPVLGDDDREPGGKRLSHGLAAFAASARTFASPVSSVAMV